MIINNLPHSVFLLPPVWAELRAPHPRLEEKQAVCRIRNLFSSFCKVPFSVFALPPLLFFVTLRIPNHFFCAIFVIFRVLFSVFCANRVILFFLIAFFHVRRVAPI